MPARLVQVTIINSSSFPLMWQDDGRDSGFWQEPWYPSNLQNLQNLQKGQQGTFRLESGGIATGAIGWARFKVAVPFASNVGDRTEFFTLNFSRAYIETTRFRPSIDYDTKGHPGGQMACLRDLGYGDIANMDSSPIECLGAVPIAWAAPIFLINDALPQHIAWVVELIDVAGVSTLPLRVARNGVIYTVMDNGDLLWFRHDGRADGTFRWASNEGRKVGNGWNPKHVFSG